MTWKRWIKELQGVLIFPIICFELTLACGLHVNWFGVLLLCLCLIRIIFVKSLVLLTTSLISSCLGGLLGIYLVRPVVTMEQNFTSQAVIILPDTVSVTGDLITFLGQDKQTNKNFKFTYYLTSEAQQKAFIQLNQAEIVAVTGKYQPISSQRNLHGFNDQAYLASKNIRGRVLVETFDQSKNGTTAASNPLLVVRTWRKRCIWYVDTHLPKESAYYTKLFFLGYQEIADSDIQENWKKLGILHIFSLSGMHIFFFLTIFRYLMLRCGVVIEYELILEGIFIVLLCLLTGYAVGMIRAGMQTFLKRSVTLRQWPLSLFDIWALTLFLHSLLNPYVLLSVGGQLSYYLSFMILLIQPILKKYQQRWLSFLLFDLLLASLSLPLIWYYFYEWNVLTFLFSAFFAIALLYGLMPFLLGALLVELTCSFSGLFVLTDGLIGLLHRIRDVCAQLTGCQMVMGKPPLVIVCLLIVCQLIILHELTQCTLRWQRIVVFSMCFSGLACFKFFNPFGLVAFIDVGQGDAIYIREPFNRGSYLIDTGGRKKFQKSDTWRQPKRQTASANYTLIPFLKSQGNHELTKVFLTHAHDDHFGDLSAVTKDIWIKELVIPAGSARKKVLQQMLQKSASQKMTVTLNHYSYESHFLTIQSLYPMEIGDGGNDDSLVLKISLPSETLLLMGDLETSGEQSLLTNYSETELNCDILKLGHHGSKTSSHLTFLQTTSPRAAIASCGLKNRYGHPSPEIIERLATEKVTFYRTDLDGMVYFKWLPFQSSKMTLKTVKK
ncbi:DNA internalization-related competence protein ComEC/Rec2 [Vagococcus penaei]|uniref:DNA internalization-related competence protein ComEC/Rec2 n=1 Tax=Vagococcus penaei TaxID=633807 RepID=A0A1Q2D4F0_9ENTE|nr:DNA internalization-related competence protein ComEC/Rec2 [Vagococcus penaei]AQP53233.1 DNA internalization-related competence protein ComEC/Rec2 [Vagococcus penaei]RST98678.1 DNA internalization-related competence protein ComEC/Rec2 [Vagococcus penaei]